MSMYVFAPAGCSQLRSSFLQLGVEFIGFQQPGVGSLWAKGKRYIKAELMCSSTAIKRTCVVKSKVFNHNYEEYGTEVYYYHTDYCAKIVKFILDYLVMHSNDPTLPQVFSNADFNELLRITYEHRISQIKWVSVQNYMNQGEAAECIYNDLINLC